MAFFIGLMTMIIVFAAGYIFQKRIERGMNTLFTVKNRKSSFLVELISGFENLKGIVAEGRMHKQWNVICEESAKIQQSQQNTTSLSSSIFAFLQNINYILFVIVGVFLIIDGTLTMGGLIACTILSSRAVMPMIQGASLLTRYAQVKLAYYTIEGMMKTPSERLPHKHYMPRPILKGEIRFENVSFRYNEKESPILNHLSFHINPGDKVALLGRIGSGKSTIQKLLMGFYAPSSGHIFMDGTDIHQIDPADLRRNISYLPQDIYLFNGSIAHNILLSDRPLTQDQVDHAVNISGVGDFIKHHPHGFQAQVGEGGKWLSGGQRQSIGLARCFLHPSPILILDEPTSMMDQGSEHKCMHAIEFLAKDKTLLLITHNLNLLSLVDKVLFLHHGSVSFFGTKEDFYKTLQKKPIQKEITPPPSSPPPSHPM